MSHAIFMNLSKYQMRRIEYLHTDRFKDIDTNTCAYLSWIFLKTRPSTIRFHLPQQDIDGAVIDPFSGVLSSDDKLKERLTACFLYIEEYRIYCKCLRGSGLCHRSAAHCSTHHLFRFCSCCREAMGLSKKPFQTFSKLNHM